MNKIAIFDVDGVILDSMSIWDELPIRYLQSKGKTPKPNLASIIYPMSLEESSVYLKNHYQLSESSMEIQHEVLEMLANYYKEQVPLKKGIMKCIQACQKMEIPMFVFSIGEKQLIQAAFQRLHIASYFSNIYTTIDKHDANVYVDLANQLNRSPNHLLVFEDSLDAIESAHKARCFTIGIADPSNQTQQTNIKNTADIFVPNLETISWQDTLKEE